MVVVIKIRGDMKSPENLRKIAGYMINIESGYEYYDSRGEFKQTKKKFNNYSHKNVEFDFSPTAGKIVILGNRPLDLLDLMRVINEMPSPHIRDQFFPKSKYSGQHVLIENKFDLNYALTTIKQNETAFRHMFIYDNLNATEKRIMLSHSIFKWCVSNILPSSPRFVFYTGNPDVMVENLNMAPSTILIDCDNYTTVTSGYKIMNYLPDDKFEFYKRWCQLHIDTYRLIKSMLRINRMGGDKPSNGWVKWEDVKLVKCNLENMKEFLERKMDYKKQIEQDKIDSDEGKPDEMLKCWDCGNLLMEKCHVTVVDTGFHILTHTFCNVPNGRTYIVECPQTFYDVLDTIECDQNSKDCLEGLYLHGVYSIDQNYYVVNYKKKKVFIRCYEIGRIYAPPQFYLF